jgi:hypothetical protein
MLKQQPSTWKKSHLIAFGDIGQAAPNLCLSRKKLLHNRNKYVAITQNKSEKAQRNTNAYLQEFSMLLQSTLGMNKNIPMLRSWVGHLHYILSYYIIT